MNNSILNTTKKVIIINAGHNHADSGKVIYVNDVKYTEDAEVQKIRNHMQSLTHLLKDFTFCFVPDDLSLSKSIQYANKLAKNLNDGLAIDIHLNANNKTSVNGAEGYYGTSTTSKQIASILSKNIATSLGIKNRGPKPDTDAAVGSLGWIRQTKMWASLVEVCYMTNTTDFDTLQKDGHRKAAIGILNGICELYGVTAPDWNPQQITPKPTPKPTFEPTDDPQKEATWSFIISLIKSIFKNK